MSLYDPSGQRKYLNTDERMQFYHAAKMLDDPLDRALCLTLFYCGCRISEALELTIDRIDASDGCLVFKTLKQRKSITYRAIPVHDELIELLVSIINQSRLSEDDRLWSFSRTTAWRRIKKCMELAELSGCKATPKGLRHAFAVYCIHKGIAVTDVQDLMGHMKLETTKIYIVLVGKDKRELLSRTWPT